MATENVLTGRSANSAISATLRLESTPPERNAPYGTSLIMRSPMDSRTSASNRSTYSSGTPPVGEHVRIGQRLPVALERTFPRVGIDDQSMAGRQLLYALEQGSWRGRGSEGQVQRERILIQPRSERGMAKQGLDLRAKQERIGQRGKVQRLHADPIARQQQTSAAAVPEREGEHPAQVVDAVWAVLLVQVQDDLGVAARAKAVAAGFEARR